MLIINYVGKNNLIKFYDCKAQVSLSFSFSLSTLQSRSQENNRKEDEKAWEHILLQRSNSFC